MIFFFPTFTKFGWGDERWGKGDFPTGSRSLFRVDRYSIYIFFLSWPGSSPRAGDSRLGPVPAPPSAPPHPPVLFFPSIALETALTGTPAPRPWSVSVRRGHRGSSTVRWRRARARAHPAWGAGSWSRGGSGC